MTPERLATVERLYHEVLAQAADERAAFLANASAGDDGLRREVESLLEQDGRAAFLSTPAAAQLEQVTSSGRSLIGQSVGPYAISAWLGAGGMGEVYRARDQALGREVAIKMLPPAFTSDPDRLLRFAREARVLASLNHPNIGAIYGFEVASSGRALVLELVEGPTLADRIARGRIPLSEAHAIARQIADALEAVHEAGIVHRDLKPGNIKVSATGAVKVLDFGLAKAASGIAEPDATSPQLGAAPSTGEGLVLGTVGFMSPEQARGQAVDKRTDIWAFGCVLYEMLAGRPAFSGSTASDTLAAILDREPDWNALPNTTPAAVHRLLRRCFEKDSKRRLRDIGDARLDLDDATREARLGQGTRPRSRAMGIAAGVAAVACVAVAGAWLSLRQPRNVGAVMRLEITPKRAQFARLGFDRPLNLALSPDGRTAIYSATADGTDALWLHPLDGTEPRALPGGEDGLWPFWSPDGKSIAFFAKGKLWRLDITRGTPIAICDVPTVFGGTWSPDGRILVGTYAGTIASVPAAGGVLTPLTALDAATGDRGHVWPQVLPGGRFLYWAASDSAEHDGVVYAASLDKPSQRTRLVTTESSALYTSGPDGRGYLLWQRAGALVAQEFDVATFAFRGQPRSIAEGVGVIGAAAYMAVAASSASGTLLYGSQGLEQLTWFDRTGRRLGTVGDPALYAPRSVRISPDGRQIAATRTETGRDLWLTDANDGTSRRMTHDRRGGYYPQWSPDGRTLLFMGDTLSALYRKDTAGSAPDQRLTTSGGLNLTDWSRDGHFLLETRKSGATNMDVWAVPVTSDGRLVPDTPSRPYLHTPVNESAARFSPEPNPRWVAYQSDESGRDEVYVQAFPESRGPHRISPNGGSVPQWGPDGRELLYRSMAGKVEAVSLRPGADSIEVAAPRELFALPQGVTDFSVSPDGRRFLVRVPDPTPRPLTVVVNWLAIFED
jgi:Tol biopolymer transport system component